MRKLKLEIADLEVTSFNTERTPDLRGTVAGRVTLPATENTNCGYSDRECACTYLDSGCDSYNTCTTGPTFNGNVSCDGYSCVDGSGCDLCYTQSCEVTYCYAGC